MLVDFLNRIHIYNASLKKTKHTHISDRNFYLMNNEAHPAFTLDKGNEVIDPIL